MSIKLSEIQWIEEVDRYLEHEEYYINWYYDWAGDEGVDEYMSERFYTSVPNYGYTGRGDMIRMKLGLIFKK
jgi:hypothetical protein